MENGQHLGKMSLGEAIRRFFQENITDEQMLVGHQTEANVIMEVGAAKFHVTIKVGIREID